MSSYLNPAPGSSALLRKELLHPLLQRLVVDALDAVRDVGGDVELLDGPVDDVLIRGISLAEGGECLQDLQAASVVIGYAVHGSASSFVYDNVFRDI